MKEIFSLMIHGGAGEMDHIKNEKDAAPYQDSIRGILERGREMLQRGGVALDVVETCTTLLEDNLLFNAGRGSALNEHGQVEMDAAIMDGRNLSAGSVAGITNIANPIRLARRVLEENEYIMLTGTGAMQFAADQGLESIPDNYLVTEHRRQQYEKVRAAGMVEQDQKHGTVGSVAWDQAGNLAAATSTGGMLCKKQGRVGDSPIIGAGVYADDHTCAVSATGRGEDFMRTVLAKHISDLIKFKQVNVVFATQQAIDYLSDRVNGLGGVIDKDGCCSGQFNSRTMIHGWIEHGGSTKSIWDRS